MFIRRSLRPVALLLLATLLAGVLGTGCTSSGRTKNGVNTYGHDGYMGLSNSNPNLPLGNSNYYSYSNDIKFMKEQLSRLPGIEQMRFVIHDPQIEARIRPQPGMNEQDVERLLQDAEAILRENMPRYQIRVVRMK